MKSFLDQSSQNLVSSTGIKGLMGRRRMKFGVRLVSMGLLFTLLITQYQNCSSQSENTMFQSSQLSSANSAADPSKLSFSIGNVQSDLNVDGYDDHIQLGGVCNVGENSHNYFEYKLTTNDQVTVVLNTSAATDADRKRLADARCENGRFYLVLPILCPNEGGPNLPAAAFASVSATLHVFNEIDPSGNPINETKIEHSVNVSLSPQMNCL